MGQRELKVSYGRRGMRVCIKIAKGEKLGLFGPFARDDLRCNTLMGNEIGSESGRREKAQVTRGIEGGLAVPGRGKITHWLKGR